MLTTIINQTTLITLFRDVGSQNDFLRILTTTT